MKKLGTIANALGAAVLTLFVSFNAQAENTSGTEPRSYLPDLAIATVKATDDANNADYVAGFISDMDKALKQGPSPDLQYVQTKFIDKTAYYGFVEPNYKKVSVCVTNAKDPAGAWEIHASGIIPIPLNGRDCFAYGREIVAAYKAQGVKFVGVNPPPTASLSGP